MISATPARSKTTHVITLESEGESSFSKFTIQDGNGNLLWSGITLYGPFETRLGSWSGLPLKSLSSIVQKLWLIDKIKADRIEKNAIHFSLNIDAQYKLPLDTDKHELSDHSELSVMLWRNQAEAKEETKGNEQKETNTGIRAAAGRATVESGGLGSHSSAHMAGRSCAA